MDIDIIIRVAAVGLAASLLLSTVDFASLLTKLKSLFNWHYKKCAVVVV